MDRSIGPSIDCISILDHWHFSRRRRWLFANTGGAEIGTTMPPRASIFFARGLHGPGDRRLWRDARPRISSCRAGHTGPVRADYWRSSHPHPTREPDSATEIETGVESSNIVACTSLTQARRFRSMGVRTCSTRTRGIVDRCIGRFGQSVLNSPSEFAADA